MDGIQGNMEDLIQWFDENGYLHECELVTIAYELYMKKKEAEDDGNRHNA